MAPGRLLCFRICVALVVGVAAFLETYRLHYLAGHALRPLDRIEIRLLAGGEALVVYGCLLLCAALLWRSAARPDGRVLAVVLALLAYTASSDASYLFRQLEDLSGWVDLLLDTSIPVAGMMAMAGLLHFASLFPRPLTPADLPPRHPAVPLLRAVRLPARLWLAAAAAGLAAQAVNLGGDALGVGLMTMLKAMMASLALAGMALSALLLRVGYLRAGDADRRRVYWVLEGLFAATAVFAVATAVKVAQLLTGIESAVSFWYGIAFFVSVGVMLVCLAVAMFASGALDPRLAIRRTAVAGLLGVALVFVFAGSEQVVQLYLVSWLGLSERTGGMLTGGMAAFALDPLRRRVERLVGRLGSGGAARASSNAPGPHSTAVPALVTMPGSPARDEPLR